jgi:hypothetical protein
MNIDEIIVAIENLHVKEALLYLSAKGIRKISEKGYEKLKLVIQRKFDIPRYAFVPNKQEAEALKEFGKNPNYDTIKSLLPKYQHIDVIRTGLLLKSYIERGESIRSKEIKTDINRRPNGEKFMSIIHLVTTPHFSTVIAYLIQLKNDKGYSKSQLQGKFEEIVDDWEESHLPVRSGDSTKRIKDFCIKKMKEKRRNIFLLGMRNACDKIDKSMRELRDANAFEEYSYEVFTIKSEVGVEPRIEVTLRYKSEAEKFLESD